MDKSAHEQNRRSWNEATTAHRRHRPRQVDYFREGGSTLYREELELLGDIEGRRLAHLMCNAGQDSVSLAAEGARVFGVDISDVAIEEARELAAATGRDVEFERADLYKWFSETERTFELAFSSYGIVPWLSDLELWARGIEQILEPGGAFVLLDYHPVAVVFDENVELTHQYHRGARYDFEQGVGDYVAQSGESLAPGGYEEAEPFENPEASVEFPWTFAETIQALVGAGLSLEVCREYSYSNGWRMYESLVAVGERRWGFREGEPNLPLMFGLRVRKPA